MSLPFGADWSIGVTSTTISCFASKSPTRTFVFCFNDAFFAIVFLSKSMLIFFVALTYIFSSSLIGTWLSKSHLL